MSTGLDKLDQRVADKLDQRWQSGSASCQSDALGQKMSFNTVVAHSSSGRSTIG